MEKNKKKTYEKPKVRRVKLDAQCAVLGFCKTASIIGIALFGCGIPGAPCTADTS